MNHRKAEHCVARFATLALVVSALLVGAGRADGGGGADAARARLVLLRRACEFAPRVLHAVAAAAAARDPPVTVLPYEDTCAEGWELRATRRGIETLASGGGVAGAGWEAAGACEALLELAVPACWPAPSECWWGEARAAALAEAARQLGWRRARVLPAEGACAVSLRQVAAALLSAGVAVRTAPLHPNRSFTDEVVIACEAEGSRTLPPTSGAVVLRPGAPLPRHLLDASEPVLGRQPHVYVYDWPHADLVMSDEMPTSMTEDALEMLDATTTTDSDIAFSRGTERAAWDAFEIAAAELDWQKSRPSEEDYLDTVWSQFLFTERRDDGVEQLVTRFGVTTTRTRNGTRFVKFELFSDDFKSDWWWEQCGGPPDEVPAERLDRIDAAMAVVITAATGVAALGALAALCWAGMRRLLMRGPGEVVLRAVDFTFPPDEHRRVGEGMEVVSCWLQRLHELAAPAPAPGAELLRAAPPSAPCSTPSVNKAADARTRYKGDAVHLRPLPAAAPLELRRAALDHLLVLQRLRHENLNPFLGCLCEARASLVWDHCGRGSLEDVLRADDIALDWTFRLSLLTDAARGLRYLHESPLRVHGWLTSRNCVVDSRWVLRLTDFGATEFSRLQGLPTQPRSARDMLWAAPEQLREWRGGRDPRATQPADIFSFAIIMQEVIVRGEPYCMLSLTPDELVEKLCRPPPLIRPSVSMGAAPPDAVNVMRQCWAETPDLRPNAFALDDIFRRMHRGRKINIVDSMFEMLEKYSNNLEELIRERTEQLDLEKRRTEQLLNRMLPRSVAERLLAGQRVEPEEFEDVSVYFSDIVGFTELAARSTPVQVVDLLNDLYTSFDATIEQYHVYKVETIGDAYMVVSGAPVRRRDHAESVATMALHLLHVAGRFRVRHLPQRALHLRIGLHSGPVCAAVVGLTMPRYCLFGDTVNTASRMESTGAAWRIHLSAETARHLFAAGGYRLRSRGLTQVKGKGAMHTYWLLGKDGFDKPLPVPPPLESEETLVEMEGESEGTSESDSTADAVRPPHADDAVGTGSRPTSPPTRCSDRYAWQRSGAVSADSSPPHGTGEARYRCLGGRVLRRQWSLERGDALAAAAGAAPAAPQVLDALALLGGGGGGGSRPVPRYRTRPPPTPAPPP